MTIRFSSTEVKFADATIALPGGASLTAAQIAELVAVNALPEAVAVVCPDRATLIAATKAFAVALRSAPVAPKATTQAPRFTAIELKPVGPTARIAALEAEVVALTARLEAVTAERNYLDTQVVELGAALAKKAARRRAPKAQA